MVSGEGVGVEEINVVWRQGFEEAKKGGGGFNERIFAGWAIEGLLCLCFGWWWFGSASGGC